MARINATRFALYLRLRFEMGPSNTADSNTKWICCALYGYCEVLARCVGRSSIVVETENVKIFFSFIFSMYREAAVAYSLCVVRFAYYGDVLSACLLN